MTRPRGGSSGSVHETYYIRVAGWQGCRGNSVASNFTTWRHRQIGKSSSEWSAGYAFNLNFNNNGNLNFNRNNDKSNTYRVRAVLAYLVSFVIIDN